MVLWKESRGRWITDIVHTNPIEFDMLKLDNDDAYLSLRTPKSIDKSMQPVVIVGGFIVVCWWLGGQCAY
jgi:hypothetical protein